MNEKDTGLSDEVIIEIVHGIKEIVIELIDRAFPKTRQKKNNKSSPPLVLRPVLRRSCILCMNFLSVLKGEADIVSAVDSGEVHHAVPAIKGEHCQRSGYPRHSIAEALFR